MPLKQLAARELLAKKSLELGKACVSPSKSDFSLHSNRIGLKCRLSRARRGLKSTSHRSQERMLEPPEHSCCNAQLAAGRGIQASARAERERDSTHLLQVKMLPLSQGMFLEERRSCSLFLPCISFMPRVLASEKS